MAVAGSSSSALASTAQGLSRRIIPLPLPPSSSPPPLFPSKSFFAATVQHGVGSLVARATASVRNGAAALDGTNDAIATQRKPTTTATFLTQICHQAPYRLIPLRSSSVEAAGAAACYLSNYGGGLLPGDSLKLNVHVHSHATLGLLTQGSNRIYRPPQWVHPTTTSSNRNDNQPTVPPLPPTPTPTPTPTQSHTHLRIDPDALLVLTPDPITPFADSLLEQQLVLDLHPNAAGACVVDWMCAGRLANGEQWHHQHLVSRTEVRWLNRHEPTSEPSPAFIDSVRFDADLLRAHYHNGCHHNEGSLSLSSSSSSSSWSCNAVATMILYGPHVQDVVERCHDLQLRLIEPYARTRQPAVDSPSRITPDIVEQREAVLRGVSSSRVLLSVSELPPPPPPPPPPHNDTHSKTAATSKEPTALPPSPSPSPLVVVRWATGSNEDLYRLLHYCLLPLAPHLGYQCYQDRIRATRSASLHHHHISNSSNSSSLGAPPTRPTYNWASTGNKNVQQPPGIKDDGPTATTTATTPTPDAMLQQHPGWDSMPTLLHSSSSFWSALMLADSSLPVGSFAHSTGLEAAAQLHLWSLSATPSKNDHSTTVRSMSSNNDDGTHFLQHYISAVTQSVMELYTPTIVATHQLNAGNTAHQRTTSAWQEIDHQLHLRLVSNPPACRASLDQGRSLLRLGDKWDIEHFQSNERTASSLLRDVQFLHRDAESSSRHTVGHLASIFGVVTLGLGLEALPACHLMGYCVARDVVSAAVRLNLVGPMASVAWLAQAQSAAQAGIERGRHSTIFDTHSSCSPLLDLIQPWHDVLATRLFRT